MLERAYNALIAAGIDARLATRHVGTCTAPYCILYEGDVNWGKTVAVRHVVIDVLVPAARPQLLPGQMEAIRAAMAGAGFRPGAASPTVALEDYKAVCATLDFVALCGA